MLRTLLGTVEVTADGPDVSLADKARRGVGWASVETGGRNILSFAIFAVLARLLGPKEFGLVALAWVYVAFVQILVRQGFWTAIVQRHTLEREHVDSAFWINLIVGAALCALTIFFAPGIAALFQEPRLTAVLQWLSLLFIVFALSAVPSALLTRDLAFRALAVRSLVSTVVGGLVGLTMAFAGWGVWSLVGQQLVAAAADVLCLWGATEWRPRLRLSNSHAHDLYRFSTSMLGNDLLWFVSQRSDQTLVGYKFGALGLGPYALASKVIQITVLSLSGPLEAVALPALSRLQSEPKRMKEAFYKFSEVGAGVSFPVLAGIIVLAPDLVLLAFGPGWTAAVPILRILAVGAAVRNAFTFFHPLMLARGKPGLYFCFFAALTALTTLSGLVATRWSPAAIALAMTVALAAYFGAFLFVARSLLGISVTRFCQSFAVALGSSTAMALLILVMKPLLASSLTRVPLTVACVAIAGLAYVMFTLALKPEVLEEIRTCLLDSGPVGSGNVGAVAQMEP